MIIKSNTSFSRALALLVAFGTAILSAQSVSAQPEPILHFDGVEGSVDSGLTVSDLGIDGSNPKTIEAWVYVRTFNAAGVISMGSTGTDGHDFTLRLTEGNREWQAQFWGGGDIVFEVPDSFREWTHIAMSYDGTTVQIFANGVLLESEEVELDTQPGQFGLRLGKWYTFPYFHGSIRDVRVWNVARSESEIQATMNSSPAGQNGLLLWWPLDEGQGRVAADGSGNGRDGIIFGAQWEGQQFEYDPAIEADVVFDFGTTAGKANELSLLRNRPDHFNLVADALRMTSESDLFVSSSAAAFLSNRAERQDFTVESEFVLNLFPDLRESRIGLVALGGPHVPGESPFNTAHEEGFYTFSFFPAVSRIVMETTFPQIKPAGNDTAIIAIGSGFDGPFRAAARWDGRKPLPNPVLLEDDFEDADTDANWQIGGANQVWEIGSPSYGPEPLTGERVAATNLDGAIDANSEDWLRSPVIDLTETTSAELNFREALHIDDDIESGTGEPYHNAFVRVVDENGGPIVELARYSGNSNGWRTRGFVLPEEALGQRIRIEFHVSTDGFILNNEHGWMIDDFSITSAETDLAPYAIRGEGVYGLSGDLELTLTLTDLAEENGHSQSISTTIQRPHNGNLFGVGGSLQSSPLGGPEIDFRNLAISLGDVVESFPTTTPAIFEYSFGAGPAYMAPDNFSLMLMDDWELRESSLRLRDNRTAGNSLALTLVNEFASSETVEINARILLADRGDTPQSKVGLVLFGEEDIAVFNADDPSTYYTFQYVIEEGAGGRIVFREGMDGAILYDQPFPAEAIVGATYDFGFTGASNGEGIFEFTATLADGNGGQASLSGELSESLESRNLFGIGGSQEGDHVWDVLRFGGNTTSGESRFLLFNGFREVGIEIGADVDEFGIVGDHPKTVEAWVFARSFGEGGGVFDLGNTADGQNFSLRTSGGVQEEWHGQFWGGADTWFDVPGSYKQWAHIATVYDGMHLRLYANGELVTERDVPLNTQPGTGMRIGIWGTSDNDYPFHGAIRDVRVWDRARSASEIQATMNSSPAGEPGLLGWWPLNEGVGEIAYDNSGNGRDGVITEPEWTSAARSFRIGGPDDRTAFLDFDGNNSRVENGLTASDLGIGGSNPKTMEAWVRAAAFDGGGVLQLGERGSGGHDFSLRVAGRLNEWQGQFWGQDMWFMIPGSLNNWTHVAITYDGSTVRAYGNGHLVDIANIALNTQNGPFVIGNWWNMDHPFNGAVRDVRIWNVARSGSEIRSSMYSSPAGQAGLVGWWPLDEGEGTVAQDRSGNERDGTIIEPEWDLTPTVWTFDTARVVLNDQPVMLAWESLGTSTSIEPGVGAVETEGIVEITPPADSLTHYSLIATDQNGVVAEMPRLRVRVHTGENGMAFSDWAESYFDAEQLTDPDISGLLATPANDGVANLLKYAFGLDPWTPVSGKDLPGASVEGTKLVLTYPERLDANDIAYVPQGSFDLHGWDGSGIEEVSRSPHETDPNLEWVTVELELSDTDRAFLRVQIQRIE